LSGTDQGESLAAKTVKGAGWLMGWRLTSRLLGIVNTVVLVRLLAPSDFGLVALATSFSFAVDSLSYLGVQDALVRERALDRSLYDTGFTINLVRGSFTALIIVGCAWPAAWFFGDARLTTIFLVLALALFSSALENIGTVDFQRDMVFGKQIQINFVPRVVSIIASITCAVVWHSYWALVVGLVVGRGTRLLFTYVIHPYRPRITLRAWRRLVGFSFWSWALSMTALLQGRSDAIVIGGYLNPTAVGIYSVGDEVGGLASSELLEPITHALFAGFSSARRSGDGVASAFLRAISVVALIIMPASAGIALIAHPMMLLVFGARWEAAVPLVQLLACAGIFRVGSYISGALLMAEGVPHIGFQIELAATILRLTSLLVLVPHYGLVGAASGVVATGFIAEVIYTVVTVRRTAMRASDLAANLWRPALATAAMALVLLATGLTRSTSGGSAAWSALLLVATVAIGALVFSAVLAAAWLVAGRPRGGETYLLSLAGQALRHRLRR
jgi:O-antigen/teichoic acid export membrane protein